MRGIFGFGLISLIGLKRTPAGFRALVLLLLLFMALSVSSLPVHDPNDPLYRLLSGWEEKGYLKNLPLIRPYPPQLLHFYLQEVMDRGGEADRRLAASYRKRLGRPRSLLQHEAPPVKTTINLESGSEFFLNAPSGKGALRPSLQGFLYGKLFPNLSYSARLGIFIKTAEEAPFTPYKQVEEYFFQSGEVSFQSGLNLEYLWNGGIFWGRPNLYFQAGLMRSSLGPFFEHGPVVGPQAPEAGHFSLTYQGRWITLSTLFLDLIAEYGVDAHGDRYRLKGKAEPGDPFPAKYLIVHSFSLYPFSWFTFGFHQSVLFGGRFSPLYLLPLQLPPETQNYTGNWDNAQVAFFSTLRPLRNLELNLLIYIDDFDSLKFNSNQNKLAAQFGISWCPDLARFLRLSLDYLLVTPYMYSHSAHEPLNYLTYTHAGRHLGSSLDPNSDQLTVKGLLAIEHWIQAELWGRYLRHGNHSNAAHVPDTDLQGTIWDDGYDPGGTATFKGSSTFLKQSVLERIFQLGGGLNLEYPVRMFDILFSGQYVFEYIENKGFASGDREFNHYLKLMLGFRF